MSGRGVTTGVVAAAWSGTGGQKIRGYQSLATLMHQGHGYSPWIVADVADDMIAAEKKDPNIWDLYGKFSDKDGDGWFANDPVDGALEVIHAIRKGRPAISTPAPPSARGAWTTSSATGTAAGTGHHPHHTRGRQDRLRGTRCGGQ